MVIESLGNPSGVPVVCIHGVMGSKADFHHFFNKCRSKYHIILVDVPELRTRKTLTQGATDSVRFYKKMCEEISLFIQKNLKGKKICLLGTSFGGKLCLHVAQNQANNVSLVTLTDCGLGPLCTEDTSFYKTYDTIIRQIDFDRPYQEIRKKIDEYSVNNLFKAMLLASVQLYIQEGEKVGSPNLIKMFRFDLGNLWDKSQSLGFSIKVLLAEDMSIVSKEDVRKMSQFDNIETEIVEGSNHFLHHYQRELFSDRAEYWIRNELEHTHECQ